MPFLIHCAFGTASNKDRSRTRCLSIGTHEEGSALYDPNGKKGKCRVFYAHTGICHNRVEEKENVHEWTTLGQYLLLLCSNVDIGPDKLNDLEERYGGD
jgi:hypothetical protein